MSVDQLKALNIQGLNQSKYTKEELANFIITSLSSKEQNNQSSQDKNSNAELCKVIGELKEEVSKYSEKLNDIVEKNKALSCDVDKLVKTVACQQKFLEHLDFKEREHNLIIINLPEDGKGLDGATNDKDKFMRVLEEIGEDLDNCGFKIKRLGKIEEGASIKPRPCLIILDNVEKRSSILQKVRNFRGKDDFKDIRVKKDQHPAIRKEWYRMFKVEEEEKKKPENAGSNIVFDKKKRVITRDGVVIERWHMSDF